MRNNQVLIILLSKTKNMKFSEQCSYINYLNLTIREIRSLSRSILKKYLPISYKRLSPVLQITPIEKDGLLEITSITSKEIVDWGFMISLTGDIDEETKLECSKPPSNYDPDTYVVGIRCESMYEKTSGPIFFDVPL